MNFVFNIPVSVWTHVVIISAAGLKEMHEDYELWMELRQKQYIK